MKNIKKFLIKNLKWIIMFISFILVLCIINSIHAKTITSFDNFWYDNISLFITDKMTFFVIFITNIGSAFVFILITLLIMLVFKNKKYGILTGINLVVVFLFNVLLKFIFVRERPIDINLIEESGYSFPSGHAMVSTAFYGFLIYLILQSKISKKMKIMYSILLTILIIFICITRVYLGVHYASDIFGGALISIIYLILFTIIISKYLPNKNSTK